MKWKINVSNTSLCIYDAGNKLKIVAHIHMHTAAAAHTESEIHRKIHANMSHRATIVAFETHFTERINKRTDSISHQMSKPHSLSFSLLFSPLAYFNNID